MQRVGAIYTAEALVAPLSAIFNRVFPECNLINIVDGGLIQDIIRDGKVTTGTARRLMHCYMSAVDAEADVILNTCSSVGDVVEHAQWFVPIPIFRIDKPMAEKAVITGERIGVLATLPTTLAPTVRLIAGTAAANQKKVEIVDGLAEGAFAALVSGHPEEHDSMLLETARLVGGSVDVIVLAQGSMARMEQKIKEATGKTVLSSPESGVLAIKDFLSAERLHAEG